MRRSVLFAVIFGSILAVMMTILLLLALEHTLNTATTATQTAWADQLNAVYQSGPTALPASPQPTATPSQTPSPTLSAIDAQATADTFATAHADDAATLTVAVVEGQPVYSVTLTEAQINALLQPYIGDVPNLTAVTVDLQPDLAAIEAEVRMLGLPIVAEAAGHMTAQFGRLNIDITEATVAGVAPPPVAVETVKGEVAPLINQAIYDGLAPYGTSEAISMTAITITDETLTIQFIFAAPATVTPTVTP